MKLNYKLVTEILVNFIRRNKEKIGLRNVVVGVSGGIDSALSALLAVKALGKDRVLGMCCPTKRAAKRA